MNSPGKLSLWCGALWAAALIVVALELPFAGGWTIDDGVKRIAATEGTGIWAERILDGPVRWRLAHAEESLPLRPPFAARETGALALGFSPWTRALFKAVGRWGGVWWRILPALIAILVWIAFESSGLRFAFLLLPLTFYGLIPWEHALSWLLLWPAIYLVLMDSGRTPVVAFTIAGALLAGAAALRPETLILLAALLVYLLLFRRFAGAVWLVTGIVSGMAALVFIYRATGGTNALTQFSLNLAAGETAPTAGTWLQDRAAAVYSLLLGGDPDAWISLLLLGLFAVGTIILFWVEKTKAKTFGSLGVLAMGVGVGLYQFRLWSSPVPPLWLLQANSLVVCLPWVLLLLRPPYAKRPALLLAVALTTAAILITPVWAGVHWGPRILLFIVPILLIDLHRSGRARGFAFAVLLSATLLQTVGSAAVVYARARETADRVALCRSPMGTPVICPTMSQCVDYAPLWQGREFFTAATPRELRRLLCEMRFAGLERVWLHAGFRDQLFEKTFPEKNPVTADRVTFVQAKSLYSTWWHVYELNLHREDKKWAVVLETAAGEWLVERRWEDALRFQREAVEILPDSATVHHNLAVILADLGRFEEARTEAQTALELNPDLESARRLLELLTAREAVP
ncbi:tetratricopeptide repeat protein [bacterium]|nr:tetratricopeptide repeat protein [bacterium]MBU1985534.1 tetratricopeptide repeat protein [bacterium]